MTEQAVQDPVPRIAQMEAHLNTASQAIQAIRDATERATAAENRARGAAPGAAGEAGVRAGAVPTALVDTRLLGKPRTLSGALADFKPWRFIFTT